MKIAIVAALLALVVSPSAAQTAASEIARTNGRFEQALDQGNVAMIAGMYTEHALVLPPNAEIVEGHDAIRNYWESVIAAGLKNLSLRSIRIDEYGADAAREIGRFRIEARDQTVAVEGKYVILWRKGGSGWQHDSDIWNFTEAPGPDAAADTPAASAVVGTAPALQSR
jgi:ketosteroid isomerase-like protein